MELIENNIELINISLSELLIGARFDKFCYSGIYSMEFTLERPMYNFDYCQLDIATAIVIGYVPDFQEAKKFSVDEFHKIWGKVIEKVKLNEDLSLTIIFEGSFFCNISSRLEDPEGLFDMRWSMYQNKEIEAFSVWVSDEENIYLRRP
jgi:hypothetical protein